MYKGKRIIGVIPARGGSKGLPGKNIRPLDGRPLIAWTIEQAGSCGFFDRVIVSTDDEQIAAVARSAGAEVPFIRPPELATDEAKTIDVILHALDWLKAQSDVPDIVALLQATSPLRTAGDIAAALDTLFAAGARSVISVCKSEHHPFWSNVLPENGSLDGFLRPELLDRNRQDLPVCYRLNGAIYVAYYDVLREQKGFFGTGSVAYVMPVDRSVDIDTELDFDFTEFLLQRRRK